MWSKLYDAWTWKHGVHARLHSTWLCSTVVVRCNFYLIYYRLLERSVPIYSFHVIYKGHRSVKIGVGDWTGITSYLFISEKKNAWVRELFHSKSSLTCDLNPPPPPKKERNSFGGAGYGQVGYYTIYDYSIQNRRERTLHFPVLWCRHHLHHQTLHSLILVLP